MHRMMRIPEIYQFQGWLRGVSPMIWRRLLVRSDQTIADLHQALQITFGWDDSHLNRFRIRGKDLACITSADLSSITMLIRSVWQISISGPESNFCTSTTSATGGSTRSG